VTAVTADLTPIAARPAPGFWRAVWLRLRRNKLAMVSLVVIVIILLVAIFAPWLAPYDYRAQDLTNSLAPPSPDHLLGTDRLGRDLLSRAIYGARITMLVALCAPLLGAVIGIPIGILAGWYGKAVDWVSLRLFEVFTTVPQILVALLLISLFGSSVGKLILFIGLTEWLGFARLARAQYISLRGREFVLSARAIGVPTWRILIIHMLPAAIGPLIIFFVQEIPATIFAAAGFSFLGLGVQDPLADWGKMLNDGTQYLAVSIWTVLVPTLCIAITTLAFSFFGDGMRDAIDPTARQAASH
jgi:ABC-type dipeptide/oligopeptide/nickel transport system permease subunit